MCHLATVLVRADPSIMGLSEAAEREAVVVDLGYIRTLLGSKSQTADEGGGNVQRLCGEAMAGSAIDAICHAYPGTLLTADHQRAIDASFQGYRMLAKAGDGQVGQVRADHPLLAHLDLERIDHTVERVFCSIPPDATRPFDFALMLRLAKQRCGASRLATRFLNQGGLEVVKGALRSGRRMWILRALALLDTLATASQAATAKAFTPLADGIDLLTRVWEGADADIPVQCALARSVLSLAKASVPLQVRTWAWAHLV